MTFEEQCSQAASQFLQTAVLVDDRAQFQLVAEEVEQENDFEEPDDLAAAAPAMPPPMHQLSDDLDAGAITRGFADKGLICSVLKPVGVGTIEADVLRLAPRSDMIVLDWQMGDNGDIAMGIIHNVLELDKRSGGRLRLFAIYTGMYDLAAVATQISIDLPGLIANGFEFSNDTNTAKVVILGKGTAGDHAPDQGGRCVEEAELATRLISEFAKFSGGILRNATLASMGHLRSNTHRLLARLNSFLDAPLITHFALVNSPQDSKQYIADLILQEIEAQVPLEQIVDRFAGTESIKARISHAYDNGKTATIALDSKGTVVQSLTVDTAIALVNDPVTTLKSLIPDFASTLGKPEGEIVSQFGPNSLAKRMYGVLGDSFDEGIRRHEEFAIASGIRFANGKSNDFRYRALPTVRLGTIIEADDGYYMCLTPVCDSVRLTDPTASMLFGRLVKDKKKFNIIVEDAGHRQRLLIDRKNISLKMFELQTSTDQTVRVERKYADLVLSPAGEEGRYLRWVAEMKPMQAQRVVGSISSTLSRIGLDEFEWLRQLAENWSG
ncbi:response regulator receiver domain [Brucella pseudogrignonensis]|uniref:response regulator receiver domain n=1 Tax=Brucella pseudogrignonensis TaxID=419475 RepID=UPI0038D05E9F